MDYKCLDEAKEQYSKLLKRISAINHNDDYTERRIEVSREIIEKRNDINRLLDEVESFPGELFEREGGFFLESVNKTFNDLCGLLDSLEKQVEDLEMRISNGEEV